MPTAKRLISFAHQGKWVTKCVTFCAIASPKGARKWPLFEKSGAKTFVYFWPVARRPYRLGAFFRSVGRSNREGRLLLRPVPFRSSAHDGAKNGKPDRLPPRCP